MNDWGSLSANGKVGVACLVLATTIGVLALGQSLWRLAPKLKALPYDWVLPPVVFVAGLSWFGLGLAEVINAPPALKDNLGMDNDRLKGMVTDRDATAEKMKEVLTYAAERDKAARAAASASTRVWDGSLRLGIPGLTGGVGLTLVGLTFMIRRLDKG